MEMVSSTPAMRTGQDSTGKVPTQRCPAVTPAPPATFRHVPFADHLPTPDRHSGLSSGWWPWAAGCPLRAVALPAPRGAKSNTTRSGHLTSLTGWGAASGGAGVGAGEQGSACWTKPRASSGGKRAQDRGCPTNRM